MSLVIDEHRQYLEDAPRLAALARAIASRVRPGMVVADLGCGTGILGLLACRAGARRVYAVDDSGMIGIARAVAAANGLTGRIVHIPGVSTRATLPERVDLVISDQIGRFGFEAGVVGFSADARRRWLTPEGALLPMAVASWVAPVEHVGLAARVDFWRAPVAGFDFSLVRDLAANTGYPHRFAAEDLLGPGAEVTRFDLMAMESPEVAQGTVRLAVARPGVCHGLAGWFVAQLSPDVTMTNAPGAADRIGRRNVFLPLEHPVEVAAGDVVGATIVIRPDDVVVSWRVSIERAGRVLASTSQSTLRGMLVIREDLDATGLESRPTLNRWARARMTVLELCDGRRALGEIEQLVQARHAELFRAPADAAMFVAEVVTRYAEPV